MMDVGSVASMSTEFAQVKVRDAVAIAVLKKSIDLETRGVFQLLQALPAAGNPPHLGNTIDVRV